MISEVRITDPVAWIAAHARNLRDTTGIHPTEEYEFAHELHATNLSGRTFRFKPGLNVIVGPNGGGKTSLLSLIAKITCCDSEMHSSFSKAGIQRNFRTGVYTCCDVRADYSLSTFGLIRPQDVQESARGVSLSNGINGFRTMHKSSGQRMIMTVRHLLDVFNNNGVSSDRDPSGRKDIRDFRAGIADPLSELAKGSPGSVWEAVSGYYSSHDDNGGTGFTFLLDTPDEGLDLPNEHLLYKLLLQSVRRPGLFQFIVSLNSNLLIRSLFRIEGVNWIDLEGDYLALATGEDLFLPPEFTARGKAERKEEDAPNAE